MKNYERATLIHLLTIRKSLENTNIHDSAITALECGFTREYESSGLHDELTQKECKFVVDVFQMFRALDNYIRAHPDDTEIAQHDHAKFDGFDGNNEGRVFVYASFLIHDEGKWAEVLDGRPDFDLNSHSPRREIYERMLAAWAKDYKLDADGVRRILRASAQS